MVGCQGEYYFGDMIDKSIIVLEELWVTKSTVDDYKTILSGYDININQKHVTKRQKLSRTPCFITGNHSDIGKGLLNPIDLEAIHKRMIQYHFSKRFYCDLHIHDKDVIYWLIN